MPSLQQTAASNETNTPNQPWRNKQSVDIWGWCHTPFQSYRPQLRDDSDNIHFILHFLVPEMHKAGCEIRDCKKKTQTSRGEEKNEAIICRNCLPHHKRASTFVNTYKAAWLHFLPMLSRYSQMSERVQHDEQCSSLHNRWRFRYDEQRSSLYAEGLIMMEVTNKCQLWLGNPWNQGTSRTLKNFHLNTTQTVKHGWRQRFFVHSSTL